MELGQKKVIGSEEKFDWSDYDHLEWAALDDPVTVIKNLRAQCPVGHSDKFGGFYVLTRHADCIAASRDPRFVNSIEQGPGPGFPFVFHEPLRMPMITDDGERHRVIRMQLQALFSPKEAAAMASKIREICNRLIDSFIESGEADLADQFSIELPAILIAELLDIPHDRRREFQGWACDLVASGNPEPLHKIMAFTEDLYDLARQRNANDIPGKMLGFEIEGRPITRDEWRGLVLLLILGGLDTTANAGGYIFHMIGLNPEIRQYLLEDRSRIAKSVPEFVRMVSPVPQHSRGISEDVEIGGHQFKKGDVVQLNWMAANYDEDVFPDAEKFDPDRRILHQLGFGYGPHMCLGRHLAVVEIEIMIDTILERIPDYQVVENGTQRFPSLNRGMSHMRVRFMPGKRLHRDRH